MNDDESSKKQLNHISVTLEYNEVKKVTNLDIIKKYIHTLPDEINKYKEHYNKFMTVLNEFALITQIYSKKLGDFANKIKLQKSDEETLEGKLILILKNQFMKISVCLNKIAEETKNETSKIFKGKMNILYNLNNIKNDYFISIDNIGNEKKSYEYYMSKYENYLINKELKKIKNKKENFGNLIKRQTTLNESNNINLKLENAETPINNDIELINKTFESQEKYLKSITESNNILKKMVEISSNEKISIKRKIITEFCSFVDKIVCFFIEQKDNILNEKQNIIPNDITNYLKNLKEEQELYNHFLKPHPYSLRCLENCFKTKVPTVFNSKKLKYDYEKDNLSNKITRNAMNDNTIKKYYKLNSKNILNIFEEMKSNNFLLSRFDDKIQNEEKDKITIKKITKQILKNDNFENLKDEFRNTFLEKLKLRNNQKFFLKILNDYRTKGHFNINKNAFEFFGEIFQYINNICLNNEDMETYKFLYSISFTYYYAEGERKHFLTDYIENHIKYKNISFWINYLKILIKWEINNSKGKIPVEGINEQKMLKNVRFNCLLNAIKNMIDFHIDNEFINQFINTVNGKYPMDEIQLKTIEIFLIDEANSNEENIKNEGTNDKKEDKKDEGNNDKKEDNKNRKENINKIEDDEN